MFENASAHEVDIDFFDQNGYLIVPNALDDEVIAALIKAADGLINRVT
jgi:ectoine hydroxylase-related dioxygenase (phytanoyl-CoA dioxygenase family)